MVLIVHKVTKTLPELIIRFFSLTNHLPGPSYLGVKLITKTNCKNGGIFTGMKETEEYLFHQHNQ